MSKKKADKPNRGSAPANQLLPFEPLKLNGLPPADKQFNSEGFNKSK
jgi:hypothetical protein